MTRLGNSLALLCFFSCALGAVLALMQLLHRSQDYLEGRAFVHMGTVYSLAYSNLSPEASILLTMFCTALAAATLLLLAYRHRRTLS